MSVDLSQHKRFSSVPKLISRISSAEVCLPLCSEILKERFTSLRRIKRKLC